MIRRITRINDLFLKTYLLDQKNTENQESEASSSHPSQFFALVGTVIVLPIILIYDAMQYRVFNGKVREGDHGYH